MSTIIRILKTLILTTNRPPGIKDKARNSPFIPSYINVIRIPFHSYFLVHVILPDTDIPHIYPFYSYFQTIDNG
jgi:hypothetical protein